MDDAEKAERVRREIYLLFAEHAVAATRPEIAAEIGLSTDEVDAAFATLHEQRHIVLGDNGGIVMAHPFTSIIFTFL